MDRREGCKWIRPDGKEVSFPDRPTLLSKILGGHVGETDLVRLTDDGPWVKAGEVSDSLQVALDEEVRSHKSRASWDSEQPKALAVGEDRAADTTDWQADDPVWKPDHAPWRRYFARLADLMLAGLVVGLILGFLLPDLFLDESAEAMVWLIVVLFGFPVIDAFTLSRWQGSFGKWLLSVRTVRPNAEPIPYGEALRRAYGVIIKGMWFGFPLLTIIPLLIAHSRAKRGEPQPWEKAARTYTLTTAFGAKVWWLVLLFLIIFALSVLDAM